MIYWVKSIKRHASTWKRLSTWLFLIQQLLVASSNPPFASLICFPVGITSSAVGIKICEITAIYKKCKLIIKKNDKIVLLGKDIEVLISKSLINSG